MVASGAALPFHGPGTRILLTGPRTREEPVLSTEKERERSEVP